MFFKGLRIDLYAKTFTAGVKRTIQAADVAMDHNLAALHGNDARRHLHHGLIGSRLRKLTFRLPTTT